ncbi:energy transducer TonB [Mucilaginibacter boryungensis]|uniref:Energy transducer TonB n=1 Tax=Mucilaginibacter boryungensis TaxID=768480 RepID=A0ABR9XH42_9SPHI|nr:energy transducer TonB [Mucilaginibacter boryungensis]MBE9666711.1 energy transducer TonB [Mucilaginibacter boryungensis]
MNTKSLSLIIILCVVSGIIDIACAQQQSFYINYNGQLLSSADSADYIRIIKAPDDASNLFNIFEFYPDGQKKLIGKSAKVDPYNLDGPCVSYYRNGFRKRVVNYSSGLMVGEEYLYFPNGVLYTVKSYSKPKVDIYTRIPIQDVKIISCNDSLNTSLVVEGKGHYRGYDPEFKYICEEGDVLNGNKIAEWHGEDRAYGLKFTENYTANGKIENATSVTADGKTYAYKQREVSPQFAGGVDSFNDYVRRNLVAGTIVRGAVFVTFTVEKDGNPSGIVLKDKANEFIIEAIKVVKNSPKWMPATHFGVPVARRLTIPVFFNQVY